MAKRQKEVFFITLVPDKFRIKYESLNYVLEGFVEIINRETKEVDRKDWKFLGFYGSPRAAVEALLTRHSEAFVEDDELTYNEFLQLVTDMSYELRDVLNNLDDHTHREE